ncbi:unnamed protein product [Lampetra planeri]
MINLTATSTGLCKDPENIQRRCGPVDEDPPSGEPALGAEADGLTTDDHRTYRRGQRSEGRDALGPSGPSPNLLGDNDVVLHRVWTWFLWVPSTLEL